MSHKIIYILWKAPCFWLQKSKVEKSDDAIFWRSTFSKAPIATTIPVVGTKNYGTSKTSILAVVKNYYRNIE